MANNFSQPQRQSPIGVLVMFFYTLQVYAKALWPILLVTILKIEKYNKLYLSLIIAAVLVVVAIISYFKYRNFTFFLDDENEEFVITEGIFNKTKTAIQLHKIQQVNINQSFIQKIIGVYELEVDTAGSNKKEGNIKAISHQLALSLKTRLLENNKRKPVAENQDDFSLGIDNPIINEIIPFIKISFASLLKVAVTSNYGRSIALMFAFFFSIYENFKNTLGDDNTDTNIANFFENSILMGSMSILIVILIFVVLVFNLVRVIFKFYDYKVSKQSGSLLLSFGLLNSKSTIIKPEKVQITTITQNFLQKKMNILGIKIKQATSGEPQERKSAIEIPGCNADERNEILQLLLGQIPEKGVKLLPNYRKLVFTIFTTIMLPLFLYLGIGTWLATEVFEYYYLLPFYVIGIGLLVVFGFKNNRLFVNDSFIIKQSGAWDISNDIIAPDKIQAITTSQLFWHKKANIGSLILHTAGGDIAFQLGNFEIIKEFVNQWLYKIETSDSNWM